MEKLTLIITLTTLIYYVYCGVCIVVDLVVRLLRC